MKRTLKIVGAKAGPRLIGSGAFRRDVLEILKREHIEVDIATFDRLIVTLEERYTPRHPSIRDQAQFMVALGSLVSKTPPPDAPTTLNAAMHYLGEPLGLRFDEEPELKFFNDSPDAGDQACICSYCEEVIHEAPVIRFFERENNTEARLHIDCLEVCQAFDLIPENTSREEVGNARKKR